MPPSLLEPIMAIIVCIIFCYYNFRRTTRKQFCIYNHVHNIDLPLSSGSRRKCVRLLTGNYGRNFHHSQVSGRLLGWVVVFSFARSTLRTKAIAVAPNRSRTEWLQFDWSVAFAVVQAFVMQPTVN